MVLGVCKSVMPPLHLSQVGSAKGALLRWWSTASASESQYWRQRSDNNTSNLPAKLKKASLFYNQLAKEAATAAAAAISQQAFATMNLDASRPTVSLWSTSSVSFCHQDSVINFVYFSTLQDGSSCKSVNDSVLQNSSLWRLLGLHKYDRRSSVFAGQTSCYGPSGAPGRPAKTA